MIVRMIDGGIMWPEIDERPQADAYVQRRRRCGSIRRREQRVAQVHGVLTVQHQQCFLDDCAADLIPPDGKPAFEPELDEMLRALNLREMSALIVYAEPDHR